MGRTACSNYKSFFVALNFNLSILKCFYTNLNTYSTIPPEFVLTTIKTISSLCGNLFTMKQLPAFIDYFLCDFILSNFNTSPPRK
jgi:hypothetical protein